VNVTADDQRYLILDIFNELLNGFARTPAVAALPRKDLFRLQVDMGQGCA